MFGILKHMGSNPVELHVSREILRFYGHSSAGPCCLCRSSQRGARGARAPGGWIPRGLQTLFCFAFLHKTSNSTKYSLNCRQIWTLHFEADLIEVLDQSRFEPQVIPSHSLWDQHMPVMSAFSVKANICKRFSCRQYSHDVATSCCRS